MSSAPDRASRRSTTTCPPAGRRCWRACGRSRRTGRPRARAGSRWRPAASATRRGPGSRPRHRTSSWSPPMAGSRTLRQVKEPAELERIGAACAVADAALERLLPAHPAGGDRARAGARPGMGDAHPRRRGARVRRRVPGRAHARRCPTARPGDRPVAAGEVLLFDFGAQVCGYRSDMTRTLFVGEPTARDLAHLRARGAGPGGGIRRPRRRPRPRGSRPATGPSTRRPATSSPRPGMASTSVMAWVTASASRPTRRPRWAGWPRSDPLPSPTVFSVEPGVYLDGETGVRIEDLVAVRPGSAAAVSG